ncbi:unnamed protein product [marine sediment metagenome]|uniref:Uncharacterized protein n=1 Tax=marine sediment metagenome TaxID=412755 RepID=X1I1Y2_9ZZZZ
MEKNEITEIRQKEWELLKGEYEKITTLIKALKYEKGNIEQLEKLWVIEDKIFEKIEKFVKYYPALFK